MEEDFFFTYINKVHQNFDTTARQMYLVSMLSPLCFKLSEGGDENLLTLLISGR